MWFKNYIFLRWVALAVAAAVVIFMRNSGSGVETFHPVPFQPPEMPPVVNWTKEEIERNPNVIVVLSESFWDPTQIEGLKFSRDPVPAFHALQEKYTSGKMLSPQFGGGTANVEFEVLTGNSMRFLPEDSIAYETVIKHDVDSLAGILSRQGYTSTAVTPFHHWYFDSSNVYRHFGFSRNISLEFFNPDEFVGPYIGDHAVAKRIIEESSRSSGPDFIFANTMENHYHYFSNKFKKNTISIQGNMPGEAIDILETYAQGASGADAMLQELVQYFSRLKEPTILVFFGDHLPFLEKDYYVYRESNYLQGEQDPDFLQKMYNVPLLIWNNYLPENKQNLYFSPSFLSPFILQLAQLKGSEYTDFLAGLSKKIPVIPPKAYYEAMQIKESDLAEYKERQQRILSVSSDVYGEMEKPLSRTFTLGYGEPVIQSVMPESLPLLSRGKPIPDSLKTTVTVSGGRYGIGSTLFANGKPLTTIWQSEDRLSAVIPNTILSIPGTIELQVRVLDEKKQILAESKPVFLSRNDN